MTKAITKYRQFHQHEPRRTGSFTSSLAIPETALCIGAAKNVLYRSDKLNPETLEDEGWIDYIHKHDAGVKIYVCGRAPANVDGEICRIPQWIQNQRDLVWLGDCIGFEATGYKAKGAGTLPELYTTPSGKALLVIQSKRTLLALIFGGRLGVEPRGIVH